MPLSFQNPWAGGALGKIGTALEGLIYALENSGGEGVIRVKHEDDGSLTIKYLGRDAKNGWNGKIANSNAPTTYIVDIDVGVESNIRGTHICFDPETGDNEWSDGPSETEGWKSYHVADAYQTTPAGFTGGYHLNRNFNGAIINAVGEMDRPSVEKNILSAEDDPENPGELKWIEGALVIEANDAGAPTGFVFAKPAPEEIDAHSQMQASGGSDGQVLTRTASGAGWAIAPGAWPESSTLDVVTGVGVELIQSETTLTVKLTVSKSTIDFNAKTITPLADGYPDSSVSGAECD